MKFINMLKLHLNSKKKSIGDKIFMLHLRTTAIILITSIIIIIGTNQYKMAFEDTLVVMIMLFAIVYVVTLVVNSYIIKKYFEPLQNLIDTANRITDGRTLSKRISIESNHNQKAELEIVRFTKTFNRMLNRLENAFQHEQQFSRDISHEIKTPLAVIVSNCEYAQDYTDNPEEMQETLQTISEQANRIASITSKLSMLAKMDGNDQKLDYEYFYLDELIKITVDEVLMEYQSLNKNITVDVHCDDSIGVHADRIMMVRLFVNLISNSIKYGVNEGHTDVFLSKKDRSLICQITDDGIGISEDDINSIWNPFFRVDRSNPNSTGLGLPMVKKIVSMHGGYIDVESSLGHGTSFYITIPIII